LRYVVIGVEMLVRGLGKKHVTVLVLAILILAFLPLLLPPNYATLPQERRRIVEVAIKNAYNHLDSGFQLMVIRIDYVDLFENPCFEHHLLQGIAWEVRLRGYTFFYIPICEIRVFVDSKTLQPLCGSIRPVGYTWPTCER